MEFIAKATGIKQVADLQKYIRIENLHEWCEAISEIEPISSDKCEADFPWGRLRVHREVIRDGLRFTLPGSAGALQWTITLSLKQRGLVIVHLTSVCEADEKQREAVERFMAAWASGIASWPERAAAALANKPVGECAPSFGGFG